MRPTSIRQINQDALYNVLKSCCINCKFFSKSPSDKNIIQSTCKKFLVSPLQNIYYEKTGLSGHDYTEKHPYAIMARLDITMCGLNGKYFIKNK